MSTRIAATLLAGALFGAALTASAVYFPIVITSQMYLHDFHMLKVFLVASASSALVIPVLRALGLASSEPRSPSTLHLFGKYDANIVGGLLLGGGMTMSGACPGTVLPQVATGISSGIFSFAGALLGGIFWTGYGVKLKGTPASKPVKAAYSPETLHSKLRVSLTQMLVIYEAVCLAVVLMINMLGPQTAFPPSIPIVGGLLIGATQASSLLLTGSPLGTSSSFEEVGHWFWYGWQALTTPAPSTPVTTKPSTRSILFILGIMVGSWLLRYLAPGYIMSVETVDGRPNINVLGALAGGFMMIFGSRLAGGCTSGHGISGMATMGLASFVSVASMFAGGILLAAVLGRN